MIKQSSTKIRREICTAPCASAVLRHGSPGLCLRAVWLTQEGERIRRQLAVSRRSHASPRPPAASPLCSDPVLPIPRGSLLAEQRPRAPTRFSARRSASRPCNTDGAAECSLGQLWEGPSPVYVLLCSNADASVCPTPKHIGGLPFVLRKDYPGMACVVVSLAKMTGSRQVLRLSFICPGSNPITPNCLGRFPLISVGHSASGCAFSSYFYANQGRVHSPWV